MNTFGQRVSIGYPLIFSLTGDCVEYYRNEKFVLTYFSVTYIIWMRCGQNLFRKEKVWKQSSIYIMMSNLLLPSYEQLYLSLWELSCRFSDLVRFRVIGRSHDGRFIPMIEAGTGETGLYGVCGMESSDYRISVMFLEVLRTYCMAYESGWEFHHFYKVRSLLQNGRLLLIPVLNPDGYEICRMGFTAIKNPGYRQQLRSAGLTAYDTYNGNARGYRLNEWFSDKARTGLENENRAMQKLLLEIPGKGLFYFGSSKEATQTVLTLDRKTRSFVTRNKSRRLVYGLKHAQGQRENVKILMNRTTFSEGTLANYYMKKVKAPSFSIHFPEASQDCRPFLEAYLLEGLFSLEQ